MRILPARLTRTARRLVRAPLFTSVAVLTLALGIGANAAIFSVVNGVLLKPLPFDEPEGLVAVWHTAPGMGLPQLNQSPATHLVYREENRVFEDIGMWQSSAVTITGVGEPERVAALRVTDGVLNVLRVTPQLGRRFALEDDQPGTPERVMLTHGYWQRKFGGDPTAIGRIVTVDGTPREVIGVLPDGFRFLNEDAQLLVPMRLDRGRVFVGNFSFQGVARLKPGATIEQANADVARMLPMAFDRFPLPPGFSRKMVEEAKLGPNVRALSADAIGDVGKILWVLLGTVGLVLLIACANVANLFLVRAEGRQQEMAIHSALGASRGRIAWELLSESLLLAAVGGAAGLLLADAGIHTLLAVAPDGLPRQQEIGIDATVVLFTAGIALLSGLLFGLLPVWRFTRPQLSGTLKEGGRGSSDGKARHRARHALVVAEMAMAVVLLVGSGLMIRTFQAMRQVDPGFVAPEEVLTLRVPVPQSVIADPEQVARTHEEIVRRIEALPGVTAVGIGSGITMDGSNSNDPIFVEDFPAPEGRIPPLRRFKWIGGHYFETLGNRVVAGRPITWEDVRTRAHVVVVTENLAREYWKEPAAALGRRIRTTPSNPWRVIVGVVADSRDDGVAQAAPPTVFWPMLMTEFWDNAVFVNRNMAYAVRTPRTGSPSLLREIQQAVWSVNGSLPIARVRTLDAIYRESMAQTSFALVMLAIAAGVALVLGVVGIYGVISYVATQRTREIGIRIALGAARGDVTGLFLRQAVVLALLGITTGIVAAALATRVMSAMLFGVSATDPLTYVAVAVALGGTALLASYIPAARAARVDPAIALRAE